MDCDNHIVFFIVIADRKSGEGIVALLKEHNVRIVNTIYGQGSVQATAFQDVFGFMPEENKVLATCLMPKEKVREVIDALNLHYHFEKPNTGIAFTIPVDGLSF